MNKHTIRTSETDSVKGLASTQKVDVNLKQTTKRLPYPNVSTTLSQMSVYEEERKAGDKYRLILTIVPYCTNVLFNPLTEIIKDEGSENPIVITDTTNYKKGTKNSISDAIGKSNPTRVDMIANTEYSSLKHGGFEYHPGYDFFDNHILRNQSFKVVNPITSSSKDKNIFNTLEDYMRDRNGEVKKYSKRTSIEDVKKDDTQNKHLYKESDILPFEESINSNLMEDNGWWGFVNKSSIDSKEGKNRQWYSLDIGKVLNNHNGCEFIDMYPDRSLFSFTPKFNKFTHENENNWNIALTYPYKNDYKHPICYGGTSYIKRVTGSNGEFIEQNVTEGNKWMGLKVLSAQLANGSIGKNSLIFRTYTKHGLKRGETFYVYYTNPYSDKYYGENRSEIKTYLDCDKFNEDSLNGSEQYYESETYYRVANVGNFGKGNEGYYFSCSDISLLRDIYKSYLAFLSKKEKEHENINDYDTLVKLIPFYDLMYEKDGTKKDDKKDIFDSDHKIKRELLNKLLRYTNFRIRRCVSGVKSTYYLRVFRKIPNLKAATREMTTEEKLHSSKFNGVFEGYVSDNAADPQNTLYQRGFSNEMYQLGFASNIYNDNITQVTFTDSISTNGLTDNLGRPLTEIYYTIIKNNAGHEVWYNKDAPKYVVDDKVKKEYGDEYTIEFSHCFGKVTSGLETYVEENDTEETTAPNEYWKQLSSVRHITNVTNTFNGGKYDIEIDKDSLNIEDDIKYTNTFFYGDLSEFNPLEFSERTISNVMHRFNTAQRETINNPSYSQFNFHEIYADDYDFNDFEVKEYSAVYGIKNKKEETKDGQDDRIDDYGTIARPEGYYYKAHYPIQIREYTRVMQGSHYTFRVRNAKPIQKNGILIQVTTSMHHGLSPNDILYICDDSLDRWYITKCVGVINRTTFLMSPNYEEIILNATDLEDREIIQNLNNSLYSSTSTSKNVKKYKNRFSWLELCEILNGSSDKTSLVIRKKNNNIPDYATYVGGNQYFWRDVVNIGDVRSNVLKNFVFANGHFYVTQNINFYLKRQDPFGINGLYFDGSDKYPSFPNDPSGVYQPENNELTKEPTATC